MRGIVVGTNMVLRKSLPTAILALGLMAFAALFLMPRLDGLANRVVSEGVDYFRGRLQTALGLSLSFESLSPSILRSASFSRLSISAPGGRSLISAGRVRVRYDIVALLQGRKSEVLTGLELEDVTLDLRLPEDQAVLDRLAGLGGGGVEGKSLPKITVSGKNVSARLAIEGLGQASIEASEVGFSTSKNDPAVSLEGRFSLQPASGDLEASSAH